MSISYIRAKKVLINIPSLTVSGEKQIKNKK